MPSTSKNYNQGFDDLLSFNKLKNIGSLKSALNHFK